LDILNLIGQIVRDLLIFVGVCLALLVTLLIVVARMPRDNPLRQLLSELCRHLAVTLAAGVVAIPIEPIPGLDVAYDTLVPIALLYYWIKFAWRVIGILRPRSGSTRPELGRATTSQPQPSDSPHRLSPPPPGL
jgi:hypothetical protein